MSLKVDFFFFYFVLLFQIDPCYQTRKTTCLVKFTQGKRALSHHIYVIIDIPSRQLRSSSDDKILRLPTFNYYLLFTEGSVNNTGLFIKLNVTEV